MLIYVVVAGEANRGKLITQKGRVGRGSWLF
jgi:hypothetical protein